MAAEVFVCMLQLDRAVFGLGAPAVRALLTAVKTNRNALWLIATL